MKIALAAIGVVVLLALLLGGVLVSDALGARDAEIARLQDETARQATELATLRRERDELATQLADARRDVTRLEGEATERQRRMLEAVAASEEAQARAGKDPQPLLALDDQLLREATEYMGHTAAVEAALRSGDLSALPAALMQMQASRARWDSLVAQRNDAVAAYLR